ncbi:MAG: efflux RND transporter periplasmic adaptor subunit [Gammaproteobacteria bacterium]|nr:efflux RND transporter periplasmic adaptor subunit [Gammaproteobacteria bacterium]
MFTMSRQLIAATLISILALPSTVVWAQSPSVAEEMVVKGPHGGKLVKQGDFDIEITVFERGIPPEMRIYAYSKGQLVDPAKVELEILLARLGGRLDTLSFSVENDYLVSNQTVTEPHSFEVTVKAVYSGQNFNWNYQNFEGRTEISSRILALSAIETERANPQTLAFSDTLFGIVAPIKDRLFSVNAPYAGIIEQLHVKIGDQVKQGQLIATVRNGQTLKSYQVESPASGQVTEQILNRGDHSANSALIRVADLSSVWIDLSAFPKNIEKLRLGLPVSIGDNHSDEYVTSTISYISPTMTGGHIARARAVITNEQGHWRPGMHVKANVETRTKAVPLAVKVSALQTFRDMPVVFAKYGNTFEVRMVELGESDGEYIEVLSGLEPGVEYVTVNSFLLKADVLKDAAKHDH